MSSCRATRQCILRHHCAKGHAARGHRAILADPKAKARLADMGGTVLPGPPADFGRLIAAETEKWPKVVKFAGIKAE
jgi:hypothetical protein